MCLLIKRNLNRLLIQIKQELLSIDTIFKINPISGISRKNKSLIKSIFIESPPMFPCIDIPNNALPKDGEFNSLNSLNLISYIMCFAT